MSNRKLQVLALVGCALQGCMLVDPIEMSGDPAALAPFSTYRMEGEQLAFATEISAAERAKIATELRSAAVSALNARGYRESADADVLVSLGAISRPTLSSESVPHDSRIHAVDPSVVEAGRPTPVPAAESTPSGVGREGDLFLYLLDPKTKRALWRANTNGSATTPSEAMRKARATYSAMIKKLPRAAGSPP